MREFLWQGNEICVENLTGMGMSFD